TAGAQREHGGGRQDGASGEDRPRHDVLLVSSSPQRNRRSGTWRWGEVPMQDSPCRTPHAGVPIELSPGAIPICADERCLGTTPSANVWRSGGCQLLHLAPTEATDLVDGREDVLLRPLPVVPDLVVAHAQHLQPVAERPQVPAPIPAE